MLKVKFMIVINNFDFPLYRMIYIYIYHDKLKERPWKKGRKEKAFYFNTLQ